MGRYTPLVEGSFHESAIIAYRHHEPFKQLVKRKCGHEICRRALAVVALPALEAVFRQAPVAGLPPDQGEGCQLVRAED
jgi:hypothetical protein